MYKKKLACLQLIFSFNKSKNNKKILPATQIIAVYDDGKLGFSIFDSTIEKYG